MTSLCLCVALQRRDGWRLGWAWDMHSRRLNSWAIRRRPLVCLGRAKLCVIVAAGRWLRQAISKINLRRVLHRRKDCSAWPAEAGRPGAPPAGREMGCWTFSACWSQGWVEVAQGRRRGGRGCWRQSCRLSLREKAHDGLLLQRDQMSASLLDDNGACGKKQDIRQRPCTHETQMKLLVWRGAR